MGKNVSMHINFGLLLERIESANRVINDERFRLMLKGIEGNVVSIGTGGSYAASVFSSKVLNLCNGAFSFHQNPRDSIYEVISKQEDVCAFTYSGKSPSIIEALKICKEFGIRRTIFTHDEARLRELLDICDTDQIINYGDGDKEESFMSIAATLIPISILLRYGLKLRRDKLTKYTNTLALQAFLFAKDRVHANNVGKLTQKPSIEILTGDYTYTAAHILESIFTEAGIAYTVVHEKNNYIHGRSVLAHEHHTTILIHLINRETDQDRNLMGFQEDTDLYGCVIPVRATFLEDTKDSIRKKPKAAAIFGEYELALKAMYLSREIADALGKDLSIVDYPKPLEKIFKSSSM